jgi:hypothetical protein
MVESLEAPHCPVLRDVWRSIRVRSREVRCRGQRWLLHMRRLGFSGLKQAAQERLCYLGWFLFKPVPRPQRLTARPGSAGRLPQRRTQPLTIKVQCLEGRTLRPRVQCALWLGVDGGLEQLLWDDPGRRGLSFREIDDTRPMRLFFGALLFWVVVGAVYYVMPWLRGQAPQMNVVHRSVETFGLLILSPLVGLAALVTHYSVPRLQSPRFRKARKFKEKLWASRVRYEGGDGLTPEQPIVIRGALHPLVARAGELWLLMGACGRGSVDWEILHLDHFTLGRRHIDEYVIRLSSCEEERTIYFDVTESYASG